MSKTTDEILVDIFTELKQKPDTSYNGKIKKIAIISTPRCGSTMFSDTLYQSGLFGNPKEWINLRYIEAYGKVFGKSDIKLDEYMDFLIRKTTTDNGVFSINIHVHQHEHMIHQNIDILKLGFDKLFYIFRKDKIAQAYSYRKGFLTDKWTSNTEASNDIEVEDILISKVLYFLSKLAQEEEFYKKHLQHLVHKEYFYEDFSSPNGHKVFKDLLNECDIEFPKTLNLSTTLRKQSKNIDSKKIQEIREYLNCK